MWERGCNIIRGDDLIVRTPAGREFQVQMWDNMPYVKKDKLHQILSDLPEHHEIGRNGRPAQIPKAARVARTAVDLDHLKDSVSQEDLAKIKEKYKAEHRKQLEQCNLIDGYNALERRDDVVEAQDEYNAIARDLLAANRVAGKRCRRRGRRSRAQSAKRAS